MSTRLATNTRRKMVSHPVDILVGTRIRLRRRTLGISQSTLAKAVGLTFQQIHRYECGDDRVSASRLWTFAHTLDVPVTYFFQRKMPEPTFCPVCKAPACRFDHGDAAMLMKAYRAIADRRQQRTIFQLVKTLGMHRPRRLSKRVSAHRPRSR